MKTQDLKKEIEHFKRNDWYRLAAQDQLDPDSIRHYVADLIDRTHLDENTQVLEIACGGGQFSVELIRKSGSHYTGLDLILDLVKDAKTRAQKAKLKATYLHGDAHHLPFEDNSFDLVLVTYSLHHFPKESLDQVTSEVFRVLKKGGVYYVLEPNGLNPIMFKWWLQNSPERVLPLAGKWRETRDLSANETIIYPWTITKSLKTKFSSIQVFGVGFFPKNQPFFKQKKHFWSKIEQVLERTPLLNKLGGSFIVLGKKE